MPKSVVILIALAIGCLTICAESSAENWPGWRGPRGDGTSREENIPLHWDGETGENVTWKTRIPGIGHASPIVWGDRVFVVSCLAEKQERVLVCLESQTGKKLWQRTVIRAGLETKHQLNSFASSTPVTDGRSVYVSFLEIGDSTVPALNVSTPRPVTLGRMVIAAYDFDGNEKWQAQPGEFASAHGYCSCPILYGDLVIVNGDHDGDSYVLALDKSSGKTVWKEPRRYRTRSYVTPLIREIDGRTQMVFSGSKCIVSLDPTDGSLHWSVEGPTEQFVASMVCDGKRFYMTGGYPTHHVLGIRPDGQGDVTDTHIAWHVTNAKCYVPSPVIVNDYLFVADDRGTANCFDTETGERHWQARLGRHFSASLTTAGGLVYFLADDGTMIIVRPDPKPDVLAENKLGEYCYASPAMSNGHIYLRGTDHLFCIGEDAASK